MKRNKYLQTLITGICSIRKNKHLEQMSQSPKALLIPIPWNKTIPVPLTSDGQRCGGHVVSNSERDSSRVSCCETSKWEAVHKTLSFDQVHFIVLQRDVLEFPLDPRLLVRQLTLKADIFALVYDTALQKLQYSNLGSCLTEPFQQKFDKVEVAKKILPSCCHGNQETKGV